MHLFQGPTGPPGEQGRQGDTGTMVQLSLMSLVVVQHEWNILAKLLYCLCTIFLF